MHIEPGLLDSAKIAGANVAALGLLATYAPKLLRRPSQIVQQLGKTFLAATFFSILIQIWHMQVGPSELHLIGASTIYFMFGFVPTLFGFALGLAIQGIMFEPQDLVHLGVNSLSLTIPLIAAHALVGKRFFAGTDRTIVRWSSVARFDAVYYAGVVAMVGFWLSLGQTATAFESWIVFALSYLPLAVLEPVLTFGALRGLKRLENAAPIQAFTETPVLRVA